MCADTVHGNREKFTGTYYPGKLLSPSSAQQTSVFVKYFFIK